MKCLSVSKDGGPESHVWAYWLFEIKCLGSIVLLRFEDGSRDAFHSHAFNSLSWVLKGKLMEDLGPENRDVGYNGCLLYKPSLKPVKTYRTTFHKVTSFGRTWVISFRGPWAKTWKEYVSETGEVVVLTNGRQVVQ